MLEKVKVFAVWTSLIISPIGMIVNGVVTYKHIESNELRIGALEGVQAQVVTVIPQIIQAVEFLITAFQTPRAQNNM